MKKTMLFILISTLLFPSLSAASENRSVTSAPLSDHTPSPTGDRILISLAMEAAPPVTEVSSYIGPLLGVHAQLASEKFTYSRAMPFVALDIGYASGHGDIKNYWHAGPAVGLTRVYPFKQFEVSPFAYTGFLWGSLSAPFDSAQGANDTTDDRAESRSSQAFALPYASGGVIGSWLLTLREPQGTGLRSVDASLGYTQVFSQLNSGYLSVRLGISLGF